MRTLDPGRAARLLSQVLDGTVRRHIFQPAELEWLLEIVDHSRPSRRVLRHYQRMLAREAASGKHSVSSLSEYLQRQQERRLKRNSAEGISESISDMRAAPQS